MVFMRGWFLKNPGANRVKTSSVFGFFFQCGFSFFVGWADFAWEKGKIISFFTDF